jgi:hypothetical protein
MGITVIEDEPEKPAVRAGKKATSGPPAETQGLLVGGGDALAAYVAEQKAARAAYMRGYRARKKGAEE